MLPVYLREVRAVLILALIGSAAGWIVWLTMPSGQRSQRAEATVTAVGPGVQSTHNSQPVQAVLTLRLDNGMVLTVKRSAKCMSSIRPGNRVWLKGVPNNAGAVTWRIEQIC